MADIEERGAIVRTAIIRSGMKMSKVADRLEISRPTLNRRLNEPFLDFDFIREVGKIITHDFSVDFKELVAERPAAERPAAQEPISLYGIESLESCKDRLLLLYGAYTEVLNKYNTLLESTRA